jgi:2'-5' RNA ligase
MDIKNKLRRALLEGDKASYEYGAVMLYLKPPKKFWDMIQSTIGDDDLYTGKDNEGRYGREDEPHVTVLYGLHADIKDDDIEEKIKNMSAPEIKLQKVSPFENDDFDVVKFDVEGDGLFDMNKDFVKLPHTSDYPDYHPHATIAYVKKGKGKELSKDLSDDDAITLTPDKVVYSKADGTKKEYKF